MIERVTHRAGRRFYSTIVKIPFKGGGYRWLPEICRLRDQDFQY